MPKLSLYRDKKSNDYKFFDKTISEMYSVGATDLYVHKYIGVQDNGPTASLSVPQQTTPDPTKIQDLLFLENRDRLYDTNIYRLRGHYNVQNLDFDLSQFGLFLNNDVIFITVHFNDMLDLIGRKLMVGDVLELPHLTDYHPLNETIPVGLRRYYQITDSNFASEGFSSTWYYHLWRIKCEPLVDSQEFGNILSQSTNTDNYLGAWNKTSTYVPGYSVTYGLTNYVPVTPLPNGATSIPPGTPCTDTTWWKPDTTDSIANVIGRYNKNIAINDAMIAEATRIVPLSGYDRHQLYLVPTSDAQGSQPVNPVNLITSALNGGVPVPTRGTIELINTGFTNPTPVIRIGAASLQTLFDLSDEENDALQKFIKVNLQMAELAPEKSESKTGSGSVYGKLVLSAQAAGPITAPYGTSDDTFATAGQDPSITTTTPGVANAFTGTIVDTNVMDFRADEDPRFTFIKLGTPQSFGYTNGYAVGDGTAPNGLPAGAGITFPTNPNVGDYFLRTDYLPQLLYRWSGQLWVQISSNIRAYAGMNQASTQLGSFVNNSNVTVLTNGTTIPEQQSLSSALSIKPD